MMGMGSTDSWACLGNGSWWDQLLGCGTGVLTRDQQVAGMRANFGASADPSLVNAATADFNQYLVSTNYDSTISNLKGQDNSLWLLAALGIGGFIVLDMVLAPTSRRYGP